MHPKKSRDIGAKCILINKTLHSVQLDTRCVLLSSQFYKRFVGCLQHEAIKFLFVITSEEEFMSVYKLITTSHSANRTTKRCDYTLQHMAHVSYKYYYVVVMSY